MKYEEQIESGFQIFDKARAELENELRLTNGPERGPLHQLQWNCMRHTLHPLYLSQAGQDFFIDQNLTMQRQGGIFVDVGGYDGFTGSNSFFFEVFRGWSGILIEPVESLFQRARTIRRCECLNVCVSNREGEQPFFQILDGYTQMSGLVDTYNQETLRQVRERPEHREQIITAPTRTLTSILRERHLRQIDCLFLDVEGAEESILNGFPFDEFQIGICCIENNKGDATIAKLMARSGYECVEFIGVDEIYVATNRIIR